jgi:hypothetical protein
MTDGIFPLLLLAVQQNLILYSFFGWFPGVWTSSADVSERPKHRQIKFKAQKKNTTFTTRRKFEIKKS